MKEGDVVLITGAGGLLGTALLEKLKSLGFKKVLSPSRAELDCLNEVSVSEYFERHKPKYVFHLASLVYGLKGNIDNQSQSYVKNTLIALLVAEACRAHRVEKIFYAGTVAAYPHPYPELPLREESMWSGEPHLGEYGYALAKRNALGHLKIMKLNHDIDFVYGILTNLYGPNDKFNIKTGHVIPSLVSKLVAAEKDGSAQFDVWGKPEVTRDFMHASDAAMAAILSMQQISGPINIASGVETSMGELVSSLIEVAQVSMKEKWLSDQPTGILRRYSDVKKLKEIGFSPAIDIKNGLKSTLDWYKENEEVARK